MYTTLVQSSIWLNELTLYVSKNTDSSFIQKTFNSLDPVLFQTLIIGVLTLFVPVLIAVFEKFLNKRMQGDLSGAQIILYIYLFYILNAKNVAIFSVLSLILLSLWELHISIKFLAIFSVCYFLLIIVLPAGKRLLNNLFEWGELSALAFLQRQKVGNKSNNKVIIQSYSAILSETISFVDIEKSISQEFIRILKQAIEKGNYKMTFALWEIYSKFIGHRNSIVVRSLLLPQYFLWSRYAFEKTKNNRWDFDEYIDWWRFEREFFPIMLQFLFDKNEYWYFFRKFWKHVESILGDSLKSKKDLGRFLWKNLDQTFSLFFDNIKNNNSSRDVFRNGGVPDSWLITKTNLTSSSEANKLLTLHMLRGFLNSFITTFSSHAFDLLVEGESFRERIENLWNIVSELFPEVDPIQFWSFLMLIQSQDVKTLLKCKPPTRFWIGKVYTFISSDDVSDEKVHQSHRESISNKTMELMLSILETSWLADKIENLRWELFVSNKRLIALDSLIEELTSSDVMDFSKKEDIFEMRRVRFLRLLMDLQERLSSN